MYYVKNFIPTRIIIINEILTENSAIANTLVLVFNVKDSFSNQKRTFRFDAKSICQNQDESKKCIEKFILTGIISSEAHLYSYPTPINYSQKLTIACFKSILNQPCLVRYKHSGENIGMLFYPHQVKF